jgi:hypothetical protein
VNRIIRAAAALGIRAPRNVREKLAKLAALLVALMALTVPGIAQGATLNNVSVTLSDPQFNASGVKYDFLASGVTNTVVQCITVTFSTSPTSLNAPGNSFDASAAVVNLSDYPTSGAHSLIDTANGTWTSYSPAADSLLFHNASATSAPGGASSQHLELTGIHNATVNQSGNAGYWYTINSFSGWDNTNHVCTGGLDTATTGFVFSPGSLMSLTVNDTLTFSIAGHTNSLCMTGVTATQDNSASPNTIPFGTVNAGSFGVACQVLSAATNATNGFTIYIRDNGSLANSLAQKIPDTGGTTCAYTGNGSPNSTPAAFANNTSAPSCSLPGSQFNQGGYGYTTDDSTLSATGAGANRFTNGGQKWAAYGHSTDASMNAEVAYEPTGVSAGTYTIAHEVGVTSLTQPGYYTTTVIYTCTPIY